MRRDHEKLAVYQMALDFVARADSAATPLPAGRGYLRDQIRRAAASVVLNIAEGGGEFARLEKARFYRMARRSTIECLAAFDIVERLELTGATECEEVRSLGRRIVAMLTRLVARFGRSGTETGTETGTGAMKRRE